MDRVAMKKFPQMCRPVIDNLLHTKEISRSVNSICAFDISGQYKRIRHDKNDKQPRKSPQIVLLLIRDEEHSGMCQRHRVRIRIEMRETEDKPRRNNRCTENNWNREFGFLNTAGPEERQQRDDQGIFEDRIEEKRRKRCGNTPPNTPPRAIQK